MRQVLFLLFIIFNLSLYAQKDTQYWYFGKNAGVKFIGNKHSAISNGKVNNWEGTGSITTKNGIFFYSDGRNIYNKFHNKIQGIQLQGRESSTQGILMLMHPENDSIIFAITNSDAGNSYCPSYYYELKIGHDTTLVLVKSFILEYSGSEKITACFHHNNRDIWLISHQYKSNTFVKYLLTSRGIVHCISGQNIGYNYKYNNLSSIGQLKFNSQGNLFCATTWLAGKVELYKFNNLIGQLYDSVSIDLPYNYGVEFSRNNYLYVSDVFGKLFQYDLKYWQTDSIANSVKIITTKARKQIGALQLTLDGKIYWSNSDSTYLATVANPNKRGDSCNFQFNGIYLLGNKCTSGLPGFNQSAFYCPSIDYSYSIDCQNRIHLLGNDTFSSDSQIWEFRKGSSQVWEKKGISNNFEFSLTDTGEFQIRYIAGKIGRSDTVTKSVYLPPRVPENFLGKDTIYSSGNSFNKILNAPKDMYCYLWQDSSTLQSFNVDSAGVYICKVLSKTLCNVIDTIIITECINNLTTPSIYRSRDTLFTYQALADSFVWFKNNVQYSITKEPFIKLTDTGNYRVEAAKKGHCNRSSAASWVNRLGTHTMQLSELNIKLYPNPSLGTVFVFAEKEFELTISDITGRTIFSCKSPKQVTLQNGIYFFNFLVEGNRVTEKVVIY